MTILDFTLCQTYSRRHPGQSPPHFVWGNAMQAALYVSGSDVWGSPARREGRWFTQAGRGYV